MDYISELPDDLLVRVLSCVPTKDVVTTSLLSKRWRSLWILVPKLDYDDVRDRCGDNKRFSQFVYRSLQTNKAPVLEKLRLSLGDGCSAIDIGQWVDLAVTRRVRELDIDIKISFLFSKDFVRLPSSLYTSDTLETLILAGSLLLNAPISVCLPSLKNLRLEFVRYIDNATLPQLLSGCPKLEDLHVDVAIALPSLHSDCRFVIDVPGLKYLHITDLLDHNFRRIENMPELVEAHVDIPQKVTLKFLSALTYVQRLSLCLSLSEVTHPSGMIFNQLDHLDLCTSREGWWDLFTLMLQCSPKLKTLKLIGNCYHSWYGGKTSMSWEPPSFVPECLLSSLEVFEWIKYKGRDGDKRVAAYVMRNAARLKTAKFSLKSTKRYEMINELASLDTVSSQVRVKFHFKDDNLFSGLVL